MAQALTYTYNLSDPVGQVRLALGDAPDAAEMDLTTTPRTAWKCVLADEEITFALSLRNQGILETAADLCLMIASSPSLLEAAIRVGDYSRDTRGVSDSLRKQADALLARAQAQPAEAIAEFYGTTFQTREQIVRGLLQGVPGWDSP